MGTAAILTFLVCVGWLSARWNLRPGALLILTGTQLDLIRYGTESKGVVVGIRRAQTGQEDYREVELDLMVRTPDGGQFPARQTALVPVSALEKVAPGCEVDTYYRPGDESAIAVSVAHRRRS